jgi:undecaprenyl-diphosphatase
MNPFDLTIIRFLNAFVGRSPEFDSLMVLIGLNVLLRGGLVVILFWWAWTQAGLKNSKQREFLLFGLFASAIAVLVARILALSLTFRVRPLHNLLLGFKLPSSMTLNC